MPKDIKSKCFEWKMDEMCDNCPFGEGVTLRESLGRERWAGIIESLLKGERFPCHKTTQATGDGRDLYCAGALSFQLKNKIETPYMTFCRGFEGVAESKATIFKRLKAITRESKR